ncbi:site-specific integrase [Azospirillum halopraeferens]|uniref:site-specific integrase n=1 Tax=Azospirillum halopraeferens TaxID=34010 RepID=UPI00048E457D|nr:site-specific integrase [Azospirillum halopraeferens]
MGHASHLILRHQTWHWRRRIPADLRLTAPQGRLSLSLKTSVLRGARRLALLLDLALEDLRMHPTPLAPDTLTAILAKVRDDALAREEARRAPWPPDLGFVPRPAASRGIVVPEALAQTYLTWLAGQGGMAEVSDADLRDPLAGRGDGIATLGSDGAGDAAAATVETTPAVDEADGPADGGPVHRGATLPPDLDRAIRDLVARHPAPPAQVTTARGASQIRDTIARGVQGMCEDASRRRDGALAKDHVGRALDGLDLPAIEGHDRASVERHALSVLAAVQNQAASRASDPGEVSTRTVPPPVAAPDAPATRTPAPTVTQMLQKCIKLKRGKGWNDKSVADATTTVRMFVEFRGDVAVDQVTNADARDYKEILLDLPKLAGKGRYARLTVRQLVAEANALEQALNDGTISPASVHGVHRDDDNETWHVERYSLTTVNKHLNFLNVIFREAMAYLGRDPDSSVFGSQLYEKSLIRKHRRKRRAYEVDELERLFRSPAWTGCVDDRLRATPSDRPPPRDARYWAPLIAAHQGMRLEEILQLRPEDIGEQDGMAVVRIREGAGQTLKTASSTRVVPLHSTLVRLGLPKQAAARRAEGAKQLFPELRRGGGFGTYGHAFSLWWTEYRRKIGVYEPSKDFHSFRTSLNTHLLRRGVNETTIKALLGHSTAGDITADDYNAGLTLADLRRALELWQLDVGHLAD